MDEDKRYKIMIVDDSSIIRKIIQKSIDKDMFNLVAIAKDGIEALTSFRVYEPDIVTLDITLPQMNGLSVLEEMLKIRKDTRIIIISALTDKTIGIEAIKKGAYGFLPKPFTADDVSNAVEKLAASLDRSA